jgi:hypothetical protein
MNMRLGQGGPGGKPAPAGPPPPSKRAATTARWCATRIVERELAGLGGLAGAGAAANGENWKHVVASFYGRHVAVLIEALGLTAAEAKAYCQERQEDVAAHGLVQGPLLEARIDRLVALAAAHIELEA